jgi:hypothetical protein
MEVFVPDANLPEVFRSCAADLVEMVVEAAQLAAALKAMQADAAAKGIDLPAFDVPDLGDLADRESLPCRLASAAMDAGILEGIESFLAPTAV